MQRGNLEYSTFCLSLGRIYTVHSSVHSCFRANPSVKTPLLFSSPLSTRIPFLFLLSALYILHSALLCFTAWYSTVIGSCSQLLVVFYANHRDPVPFVAVCSICESFSSPFRPLPLPLHVLNTESWRSGPWNRFLPPSFSRIQS